MFKPVLTTQPDKTESDPGVEVTISNAETLRESSIAFWKNLSRKSRPKAENTIALALESKVDEQMQLVLNEQSPITHESFLELRRFRL